MEERVSQCIQNKGTAVTNGTASGVYVFPLNMNDVVTNMSLDQRAKWVSEISGIPAYKIAGILRTPVNEE